MDDKKLQELYSLIVSKDASYANDVSLEQFKVKMQDDTYNTKMYDWLGVTPPQTTTQPPQQAGVNIDAFLGKEPVKKKEQEYASLQTLQEVEPTLESSSEDASLASSSQTKKEKLPLKDSSWYLNDGLKQISGKLLQQNEEYVVPQMNYEFRDLGFEFEESGITGDWMIVTAPDKKTKIEISLDTFSDSKAVSDSEVLKKFIKDNTREDALSVIEKRSYEENKKFNVQADVDDAVKKIANEANTLNTNLKGFLAKKTDFDKMQVGTEEYNKIQSELTSERNKLILEQKNLSTREVSLKKAVGKYVTMTQEQGSILGGTIDSIFEGISQISAGEFGGGVDILAELLPNSFLMNDKDLEEQTLIASKKFKTSSASIFAKMGGQDDSKEAEKDFIQDELDDFIKKKAKKNILPIIRSSVDTFGASNTTPEWLDLKEKNFWGGAYFGLVKSLPAMVGAKGLAGTVQRTVQMYEQVSDGLREEMENNPEFDNISEKEKFLIMAPIGITGAVLEEFGLKNIKGATGLINKITMSALGKAGVNATAKTFRELVENEVKSKLVKGALILGSAGLAEAETGAAQTAAEFVAKDIYNAVKGKEMFDTPDSVKEWITDVAKSGLQEAVGGFVLGIPTAVSVAYSQKGFLKMDDQTFKMFESAANDENIQKAFITKLKTQITQGVITTAEGKEQLNNYRNSVGLFRSLTEGLNTQQKKEAMNLLKEKRDLENQVDGKDSSLSAKLKERIAAIDASLVEISEVANNEKVIAETNKKEFDALPDAEKTKLKESIADNVRQTYGDEVFLNLDDDKITELALRQFVSQKNKGKRITEIEAMLSPDAETQVSDRQKNKLKKELDTLVAKPNTEGLMPIEEIFENADSESLKNKESTAKALESLATDKTEGSTFTDNEGNALPVVGNENTLAELYHEAVDTPMEQRTEAQNSAMDVVKKSLNEKVKLEKIFVEDTAPTQDDSRSASNKSDMGDMKGRVKGQAKVKVIESAQRAIKTLKSILPNFDIHIHEDEGSYNAAMQKLKGEAGSKGNFYNKGDGTGRIDINLSRASATTVAHEVAHGVMLKVFGDNPALFKKFRENISKVLKDDKNKALNEFADRYGDDVQHEEYLVQLTAILEQEQDSISTTTVQKIAAIINKVLSTISFGKIVAFQDITETKELIEFLNNVSGSIREGEDINIKESSKGLQNETSKSQKADNKNKKEAPKFVRDISALITPATVRGFNPLTKRIKKLSLKYDDFVKQYAKNKDPKILAKIKNAEAQILNDAKQDIIDAIAKVDGVSVQFKDAKRGLWENKFEPSFNMNLSISPQADTKKISDLLFDFATKYSQDAFILETESEFEEDVFSGKREIPLTEFDKNDLMHYPQIIYTFDTPITDEQVADLSVALEKEGVSAFSINNNAVQVSVIKIFSPKEKANLTKKKQYEERSKDFDSKSIATAKATSDVLGSNGKGTSSIRIKKSSYQGAINEKSADQTRQFDRSDVLKAFKESTTKIEKLAVELANLRQKEINLKKEGKELSVKGKAKFDKLVKQIQPVIQRTFETNKKLYEDSKIEVEGIAQDAIEQVDASISPFPIKRAERASVKTIRWYNSFTERLGDGARVNIVTDTDVDADKVFEIIDKENTVDKELRRISETTDLGYPKRLIEIRTSNGIIAEIQVITNEAYLAKDGVKGFTGDKKQKATAKQKLNGVRSRLGWSIPDGLGHYFYEIQRDTNVDENLRDEAARLSDIYYDAFINPKSKLKESFMKDVMSFKEQVDAADKSKWDVGNIGKAPESITEGTSKSQKGDNENELETKKKIKNFGVTPDMVEPVHSVIGEIFEGLKKAGLTAAKNVGEWVGIGKGTEKPYSLKINGKDVQVKNIQPEVVNGFYSPLEKIINESKSDKLPAKQWAEKFAKGEEANFTGLADWLNQQQGSVSKADIQQFLKDNRIQVVEVVKGSIDTEIPLKGSLFSEINSGVNISDNGLFKVIKKSGETSEVYYIGEGKNMMVNAINGLEGINWSIEGYVNKPKSRQQTDDTKFSQYQLEGQKENYKEVLVTMPKKKGKSTDAGKRMVAFRSEMDAKYGEGARSKMSENENRKLSELIALARDEGTFTEKDKFKSSHFEEPNILVHLRMNTRTDAQGNKVLFLEEVQSDWGQQGKKGGFDDINRDKLVEKQGQLENSIWNYVKEKYSDIAENLTLKEFINVKNSDAWFFIENYTKSDTVLNNLWNDLKSTKNQISNVKKTAQAPFVTDTNAWTKLGLKVALKEAVKQGADKIAWTTGEQQNDRYDLSKQVDSITYSKYPDGTYQFSGDKNDNQLFNYQRIPENKLEDYVGKEVAKKIIDSEGEPMTYGNKEEGAYGELGKTLSGVDLKVGGKGMKGFYGSPTEGSLGIVGNVAKSLFKQEPKTVSIEAKESFNVYDNKDGNLQGNFADFNSAKEFAKKIDGNVQKTTTSTQNSIDITPELKAQVEGGQPLFKDAEAQYRIENGKNIVEAIKDFNGSPRATIAIIHEIMHPTVVAIIDGAKEGNEVGTKHTKTIVDEFNKANPNNKVTTEELINENDAFKKGKTSDQYRAVQEFIARSWEKYHTEGGKGFSEAFQKVLEQITKAFKSVYKSLLGKQLTPELRKMFDDILSKSANTSKSQKGDEYTIDGKQATEKEMIEEIQSVSYLYPYGDSGYKQGLKYITYNGTKQNIIDEVDDHNKKSNPYNKSGELKKTYMGGVILKAFQDTPFRSFMDAYRKTIDKYASKNMFELNGNSFSNITFQEKMSYIISDVSYEVTEEQFRQFSKKLKITIPALEESTSKSQLTEKSISEMVKKARAEGLSDEAIRKRLLSNGISSSDIDIAMESTETSSSKIEVNEQRMPGYDAMLSKVRGIREKSAARGRSESDTNNSVMAYVMGSDVYKNASDIQREAIVRQIRKYFGLREKSAPKVTNLLDGDMVTVSSKVLVLEKIKALVRGGKDAVKAIKAAQEQLRKEIKELRKSGKITVAQLERVIGRLGKTDLLSPTATARFIDYMGKVFADAEYGQKISDAYKTRSQILSLTKNKDKNVDLKTLGVEFAKIDPSMVEDIDAYNDMAKSIEEAIRGSTIKKDNVKIAASVKIDSAMEYVKATLETQERLITEERIAEIQELMGIDATGFSAREMIDLLKSPAPLTKYNEPNIRALVSRAFDAYKSIIEQELKSGIDAFTGEPVYYTAAERKAIREFMEMDTDKMPTAKEGLDAVDSLINFLANKSTAKMISVTAKYNGQQNAKKVVAKKIESVKLKKLFMPGLARTLAEQTTNLNIVFEKMFKGFNRSRIVMEAMGLLDFINRKAYAQNKSKIIVSDYINTFYKKGVRPNGQAFNTAYNEAERGMAAFMMRNVIGTPEQRAIEFDRRKRLIQQSIDALKTGNEKEQKKSKIYEEAYNKVLADAEGINDIIANTDKINLDAIDYWHKQWDANFEQMASTSIGVYNKILERESNYSPDRFSKLSEFAVEQIKLDEETSAFHTNNGTLYKRAAGSLQEATRPTNLGEFNEDGDMSKVKHYIDLSFDRNNSNSMYDALVDIETAASIRQVQAFMNSDDFRKIVPYSEDRALLTNRINLYIRKSRGKESYSDDELSKFMRVLNKVSTIGVGQALGGVTQPLKQVIPIAFNTIINGGGLNVVSVFDKDFSTWLESIGMPISNRGIQSQTEVDNINAKIQEAADSKGEQLLNLIESANKQWLKIFLVAPDVFIARASWKGYYEKALAKQGIDIKGLDYSTHEVNMEAANYAQGMVDRQQNISDHDMSGKAFVSTEVAPQILVKSLMAFASFRMNAASRTAADLSTIGYWSVSTKEDKAIALKSLAGYAVEQAVFKSISVGISLAIGSLALSAMGKDEDDEEFEKRKNNLIKGAATGAVTDIISPVPVTDKVMQELAAWTLDQTQSLVGVSDEDKLSLFGTIKESFLKGAGTFGIAIEKASQLKDLVDLSYSGTYIDDYGKEKKITEKDKDALSMFILPAVMSNIGLAPSEVSSLVRNAVKSSKKTYKTDAERAEAEQKDIEESKENKEKINALVELKSKTSSSAEIEIINKKIRELNLEGEDKKEFKKAKEEENKIKNAKKELLLDGFENQSDMKKYAPEKWERNFGEGSEWYRDNNAEMKVNKNLRKEEKEEKEDLYNYVEPSKSKKKSTGWGTVTKKKSTGWGSANKKKNKGWGSK